MSWIYMIIEIIIFSALIMTFFFLIVCMCFPFPYFCLLWYDLGKYDPLSLNVWIFMIFLYLMFLPLFCLIDLKPSQAIICTKWNTFSLSFCIIWSELIMCDKWNQFWIWEIKSFIVHYDGYVANAWCNSIWSVVLHKDIQKDLYLSMSINLETKLTGFGSTMNPMRVLLEHHGS